MGGRIRARWPAQALADIGWRTDVMPYGPVDLHDPRWRAKVVVVHRAVDSQTWHFVQWARTTGARTVLQADDNVYVLERNANAYLSKAATVEAARMADRVIVTTDALADLYSRWNSDVVVVPNYLPAWVSGLRAPKHDPPVVGWRGSVVGHRRDLDWFRDSFADLGAPVRVIGQWTKSTPKQREMGFEPWDPPEGLDWTETGWLRYDRMIREMSRCAVGIVPLEPSRFNASKSWLAAMEWLAAGVPVVASPIPDNRKLAATVQIGLELAPTQEEIVFHVKHPPSKPGPVPTLESQVQRWAVALTF